MQYHLTLYWQSSWAWRWGLILLKVACLHFCVWWRVLFGRFCESFGEIPGRKDRIGVFSEKIYPFVEQSALVAVEVHI